MRKLGRGEGKKKEIPIKPLYTEIITDYDKPVHLYFYNKKKKIPPSEINIRLVPSPEITSKIPPEAQANPAPFTFHFYVASTTRSVKIPYTPWWQALSELHDPRSPPQLSCFRLRGWTARRPQNWETHAIVFKKSVWPIMEGLEFVPEEHLFLGPPFHQNFLNHINTHNSGFANNWLEKYKRKLRQICNRGEKKKNLSGWECKDLC